MRFSVHSGLVCPCLFMDSLDFRNLTNVFHGFNFCGRSMFSFSLLWQFCYISANVYRLKSEAVPGLVILGILLCHSKWFFFLRVVYGRVVYMHLNDIGAGMPSSLFWRRHFSSKMCACSRNWSLAIWEPNRHCNPERALLWLFTCQVKLSTQGLRICRSHAGSPVKLNPLCICGWFIPT